MFNQSPWQTYSFTYDAIGNPLNYRDGITMTWQNGRELASFENDDVRVTYSYAPDGLRTQKNYEGLVTTDYVYEGGLLRHMKYGAYTFNFSYDANGSPIGFELREEGTTTSSYYYYGLNSRGDVEALYNSAGTQIASYSYDAYGKPISTNTIVSGHTTAIEVQPLRYRSYVYDYETGLYYLQSRYYDPTTCRFVNADIYCETGQGINGYNMFAYCNNNPVICSDPTGQCSTHGRFVVPTCYECNPERGLFVFQNTNWILDVNPSFSLDYETTAIYGGVNVTNFYQTSYSGEDNIPVSLQVAPSELTIKSQSSFLGITQATFSNDDEVRYMLGTGRDVVTSVGYGFDGKNFYLCWDQTYTGETGVSYSYGQKLSCDFNMPRTPYNVEVNIEVLATVGVALTAATLLTLVASGAFA